MMLRLTCDAQHSVFMCCSQDLAGIAAGLSKQVQKSLYVICAEGPQEITCSRQVKAPRPAAYVAE
eukprot:6209318-Pleurochrysis_carterae.AAC.1